MDDQTADSLLWQFSSDACKEAGAIPPEGSRLAYGRQPPESPFRTHHFQTINRAIHIGYQTVPGDCPPMRLISRWGFCARVPRDTFVKRLDIPEQYRSVTPNESRFGLCAVRGDTWPEGDTGFVASWISGSEFVKIQTGIDILFPSALMLYQGPIPNSALLAGGSGAEVMAGFEAASALRVIRRDGREYGVANLNYIVRLPPAGTELILRRNDLLGWFFAIPKWAYKMCSEVKDG